MSDDEYVKIRVTYNKLGKIAKELPTEVGLIVLKAALDIERDAKLSMSDEAKSGRVYLRGKGKKKKKHQASAPGEAPAVDTGNLINSVSSKMVSQTSAEVRVDAEYAKALEYGGKKVAPRPFLRPAVSRAKAELLERLKALGARLGL